MNISKAALSLAYRGWPVFPCSRRKVPLVKNWGGVATTDAQQIAAWWREWPGANIGYPTGNLIVVEIDGAPGVEPMRRLREDHPWPETLTSMSGRPGLHFFYRCPDGERIPNAVGLRGNRGLGVGIDVRGHGGQVVLPPSIHPSGRRYVWSLRREAVELPAWMVEMLRPPAAIKRDAPRSSGRYGQVALEGECGVVANAAEGTLNDTLNRSAFKMGLLVGNGTIEEEIVFEALLSAAVEAGHPERGAVSTIRSGLGQGMRR